MNKYLTLIIISLLILICSTACFFNESNNNNNQTGDLKLLIELQKMNFTKNETINIDILLFNNDSHSIKVQPLILKGNLEIEIKDNLGNIIIGHLKSEDFIIENKDLLKLEPNKSIKIVVNITKYYDLETNTTYYINCEYNAAKSYSESEKLNSWVGTLHSNELIINIID